ncbi:MAG: trimethylamine methyltransferase family protein [Alphaproteobacteria bacterium]
MNAEAPRKGRAGGRSARVALRAAPLAEDIRPVRPGLEGGSYKPLSEADMDTIYEAALTALETVGMADAPASGVESMVAAGAILGDDNRLRFPRALVEHTLSISNKNLTLHAQDPKYDLDLSGNRVHFGTAGAAVHLVNVDSKEYEDSTIDHLYSAARVVDQMDNIHFFQRPMVARDILDNRDMDLNTVYASISGTKKHVGTSFVDPSHMEDGLELLHMVAGSEEAWRARPFVSLSVTFVVPPMKYATESCEVMEVAIRGGMPILLLSAGQAGATAPAAIAGAVVQAVAECLSGLVYVNSISPGHPAIFGPWPFVSDLRSGAMSGGSGEQAILTAAVGQMGKFLGLPTGSAAGMADAKMPDAQSGYEKGITNVMAGLAGINMVYESAGMHASLLGFCLESLIIDNDMLGQAMRCVRGLEVTPEKLSLDVMAKTCLEGPGHYLGSDQTLNLMQSEYIYPTIGDRTSPKEWAEVGKPVLLETAQKTLRTILQGPKPSHIPPEVDAAVRERFRIYFS